MPFEFTGEPPKLLASGGTFPRMVQQSQGLLDPPRTGAATPSATSLRGSSGSLSQPESGATPSFGSTHSFGTSPSFGSQTGSSGINGAAPPGKRAATAQELVQSGGNDVLSRALERASTKQKACFGADDIAADAIIQAFGNTDGLQATVAATDIKVKRFLRFVFEKAAENYPLPSPPLPPTRKTLGRVARKSRQRDAENELIRGSLVSQIHSRRVQQGMSSNELDSNGIQRDTPARTHAQVALEARERDDIIKGLVDEGFDRTCIDKTGNRDLLLEWVDWLWDLVCSLRAQRKVQRQKKRKERDRDEDSDSDAAGNYDTWGHATDSDATGSDGTGDEYESDRDDVVLEGRRAYHRRRSSSLSADAAMSAFLPRAEADSKLKIGQHAPGQFGVGYSLWDDERPCCKQPAKMPHSMPKPQIVNTILVKDLHKRLTAEEKVMLMSGISKNVKKYTQADPATLAKTVISQLKPDQDDATVRATCTTSLTPSLGVVNATAFVTALFANIQSRANAFRFLDLPPELRVWVYRELIVVGDVRLKSCQHRKPYGVTPGLDLSILKVNRLIHTEARDIMYENHFIADAIFRSPMLDPRILPDHTFPHLTSLMLTLTAVEGRATAQLQSMVKLQKLRICGLEVHRRDRGIEERAECWDEVIKRVLQSVPASCEVSFGSESHAEMVHANDYLNELLKMQMDWKHIDREFLKARKDAVEGKVVKGELSGLGGIGSGSGSMLRWSRESS